MRPLYYIIMACFVWVCTENISAQQPPQQPQNRNQRQPANQNQQGLPSLSSRAESKNKEQTKNIDNVVWLKEIYRWIDLTKEENAPLYFPVQPIDNRMNLFTTIFKLMCEGKIKAYEYLDEREVFTEKYELKFEDNILKKYGFIYTVERRGNQSIYKVDDSDIPSNEVTLYMVKEAWYFDQANGTFGKKILAICPMLVQEDFDLGGEKTRDPLFWLPYENIRPYIAQGLIMTSNVNNALTYTADDYFSKGMYKGEIIKTTNMMSKTLKEQYGDSIKIGQDSIEAQLALFEKSLWIPVDSTQLDANKKDSKKNSKSKSKKSRGATTVAATSSETEAETVSSEAQEATKTEEKKAEEPKAKTKKSKSSSSSSSPTKSVRRTR